MRIGIDVRYLSHGLVGGVHNYVANLVTALMDQANGQPIYLYADSKKVFELQSLPGNVVLRILPYRSMISSIYNDLFMQGQMARDQLDIAHFPANYGFAPATARTVITLHDEINILPLREIVRGHSKRPRTIMTMAYLHFFTRISLPRASLIITVSEYAKREIMRHSGLVPDKIVVVPEAPAPDFRRVDEPKVLANIRQHFQLHRPFVLADGLKNPAVLVEAWRLLPSDLKERYGIVFFARSESVLPIVRQAESAGHARLLIRPSREDLIALYSMAHAFVFPSWIEGFGLPVLEAMMCGAPVIASNRGAIPEIVHNAALLADAEDAETFARHISRVLTDPNEAQRLRECGFARVAQFSWRDIALRTLECYQRVWNHK